METQLVVERKSHIHATAAREGSSREQCKVRRDEYTGQLWRDTSSSTALKHDPLPDADASSPSSGPYI
jgi:hypothetical protein